MNTIVNETEKDTPKYVFKVGDLVESTVDVGIPMARLVGTIRVIDCGDIGVEWNQLMGGHDLGGRCTWGYGFYMRADEIKLVQPSSETVNPSKPTKEFVLPEKWYVQRTTSNSKIINKWFRDNHIGNSNWNADIGYMNYPRVPGQAANERKEFLDPEGFKEITFEQFKQYVLKEPIKQDKNMDTYEFKIGDHVKCIVPYFDMIKLGELGTIVEIDDGPTIGVEWVIKDAPRHNCKGNCKDKYGYYVNKENIEVVSSTVTVDPNIFPKDSYVVLLLSCAGNNSWERYLPEGYCYQLSDDSNTFNFAVHKNHATGEHDSWSSSYTTNNKLKLRAATETEIIVYKALGKPYKVGNTENETKQILLDEVAKRYPIGTRYSDAPRYGGTNHILGISNRAARWLDYYGIDVGHGIVYNFGANKWAEIISPDKPEPAKEIFKTQEEFEGTRGVAAGFTSGITESLTVTPSSGTYDPCKGVMVDINGISYELLETPEVIVEKEEPIVLKKFIVNI